MHEREMGTPLASQINEIFERRASAGERKLIMDTYSQSFEQLLRTLPKEKQDTAMVKIQRVLVKVGGAFHEYGARITDFIRNILVFPLIAATEDFPKDKFYQIELARAKAWGEFARNTTKTATAERNAYRDNFLPSALTIAESTSVAGAFIGGSLAGVQSGTLTGAAMGGVYGAAIGAAAGGVLGGVAALTMRYKDRILGPPVMYYNLNTVLRGGGSMNVELPAGTHSQ